MNGFCTQFGYLNDIPNFTVNLLQINKAAFRFSSNSIDQFIPNFLPVTRYHDTYVVKDQ